MTCLKLKLSFRVPFTLRTSEIKKHPAAPQVGEEDGEIEKEREKNDSEKEITKIYDFKKEIQRPMKETRNKKNVPNVDTNK
jgi:hypothetical protein